MAREDKEYEQFVQSVYQKIIKAEGRDTVKVEHNVHLEGASGQKHQIDVYWEYKQGGMTYKTAIECKHHRRKISIGTVRDFFGVVHDVKNLRGIVTTKRGYTSGALGFAEFYGIELRAIRESERRDYPFSVIVYVPRITKQRPLVFCHGANWYEANLGNLDLSEVLLEDKRTGETKTVASLEEELDYSDLGLGQIRTQTFPSDGEVFEDTWLCFPDKCSTPPIKIRQLTVPYFPKPTFRGDPVIKPDHVIVQNSREDTYVIYNKNGKKVGMKARGAKLGELQLDEPELD